MKKFLWLLFGNLAGLAILLVPIFLVIGIFFNFALVMALIDFIFSVVTLIGFILVDRKHPEIFEEYKNK